MFWVVITAWWLGVQDGWDQPLELSVGRTWDNGELNEAYDRGVNLGQCLRAPIRHQRRHES